MLRRNKLYKEGCWMVGWLDGWMVGLLDCWIVGLLDTWMVGLLELGCMNDKASFCPCADNLNLSIHFL